MCSTAANMIPAYPSDDHGWREWSRPEDQQETTMTNFNNELSDTALDAVAGGDFSLGPITVSYSKGSGAINIDIGGSTGAYIGPNGAGWYNGDKYGQIKFH
jgi:hypothetical protein